MGDKRGKRPKPRGGTPGITPEVPPNYDDATPKFCLHHVHAGHCVATLPPEKQAHFAVAIEVFATLTWRQIILGGRHGYGMEMLPRSQMKPVTPTQFQDRDKVMVLRYSGNLPMVGVRVNDVFHVLWIEADYGDVYDHGSK